MVVRFITVVALGLCTGATGVQAQISPVLQERSVSGQASVSSGDSDGNFVESPGFGVFTESLLFDVMGSGGAEAKATASQSSAIGPTSITGSFLADCAVTTGSSFVTGEADAASSLLFIFHMDVSRPYEFNVAASLGYTGRNPDGEPSDLDGRARIALINAGTNDILAEMDFNHEPGSDSTLFQGILMSGQDYVILVNARMHAFSADLLGPPARSGLGSAEASFSLVLTPAPGTAAVLALGGLVAMRRRR